MAQDTFLDNVPPPKSHEKPDANTIRFVTEYNSKYRSIQNIVKKHWHILHMDPKLGPILPPAPQITFKRTPTLKNIVAPSKLKNYQKEKNMDIRSYFDNRTCIFQCKKRGCLTCQFIQHGQSSFSDRSGNEYNIKLFITSCTEYVIYVLICLGNLLYVGRTMQTLRKRGALAVYTKGTSWR